MKLFSKLKKQNENSDESNYPIKTIKIKKNKKKIIIFSIILLILIIAIVLLTGGKKDKMNIMSNTKATVSKQNIEVTLSSTGTVEPANQYSITTNVSGEILESYFEKGDIVNEGDMLYKVDSSDMENTVNRANISYNKTYNSYKNTMDTLNDLNIKADGAGTIIKLYVKKGDEVNSSTKIADVRNSKIMTLSIPFNSNDAKNMYIGQSGTVTIDSTFENLNCTVISIDGADTVLSGNRIVRYVEVEVSNPGAITTDTTGTAIIGNYGCVQNGNFEYYDEYTLTSSVKGEIENLYVSQGDYVSDNQLLGTIYSSSVNEQIESSQLSLDDAKLSYENTLSQLDNYTITAPITGTVITKNAKVGDTLGNSNSQSTLAVIYDLSYLTFEMSIDELDIGKIEVGQSVKISSDAIESGEFNGVVSNISVAGTTQNGVTTYPITVQIDNPPEGLLPGMNVDASIIVESAQDVLAIPIAALQRGNVVYVKDDTAISNENSNIPNGYKEVKVETGITNDNYVEIKNGLSEGDVIYIPQIARESSSNKEKEENGMFGGGMPNFGGGSMPTGGGMPNMGGSRPTGGGMPGGGF